MRFRLYLFTLLFLIGCSSSDNNSQITQNLTVTGMNYLTTAYAGHSYVVSYTIAAAESTSAESDNDTPEVIVSFHLINKEEFDNKADQTEIIHSYYLGSDRIASLEAGETPRAVTLKVPSTIAADGTYYVISRIDPNDSIVETDENDNEPDPDTGYFPENTVTIDTRFASLPNLTIQSISLEEDTIVLDSNSSLVNVGQTAFTRLTPATIDMSQYVSHGNVDLQGHAEIRVDGPVPENLENMRAALQINLDGTWETLNFWDSVSGDYQEYVTLSYDPTDEDAVPAAEDGEEGELAEPFRIIDVDIDINIPQSVALAYIQAVADNLDDIVNNIGNTNRFAIRLVLDSTNVIEEFDETDNAFETTINLYSLPENVTPSVPSGAAPAIPELMRAASAASSGTDPDYLFEKTYKKYVGRKSKFKSGIKAYSKIGLETGNPYGAVFRVEFDVPVYIFNNHNTLIRIYNSHQAYADWMESTGYKTEIVFGNATLWDQEVWQDRITREYARSWIKEKQLARARFTVGPVPMKIAVGVESNVGYAASFGLENNYLFTENTLPDIQLDVYAEGGPAIGLVDAGVTANLELLSEVFQANAYAEFNYEELSDQLLSASMKMQVVNDMEAIRGKFGLFARWRAPKFCKKWGVSYPCGTQKRKSTLWFYKTNALFNRKQTLLNKEKTWEFGI
jgi:hypothetical protein